MSYLIPFPDDHLQVRCSVFHQHLPLHKHKAQISLSPSLRRFSNVSDVDCNDCEGKLPDMLRPLVGQLAGTLQ